MKRDGPFGGWLPDIDRDMARGIMKVAILTCIQKSKTYPYAILRQMKKHGSPIAALISKSDMYNITIALEKEGFIKSRMSLSGKKALKMYTITPKGAKIVKNRELIFKRMFNDMRQLIKEEFNE